MSEISDLIQTIIMNDAGFEGPWDAFSVVIGFDVEGDADNSYGYLYKPDGDFEAISADLFAIEAPMGAYLRSVYEDGPYPLKLLLQFDRNSGRFNIDFEDKNPNRWVVTPADIYGFIESLRPKFEP